jgi:aspartate 1-decarboxylase
MQRTLLKSKIHRATVTGADLNYEGSIAIDPAICQKADLVEFEKVDIYNVNNGNRFSTYVIFGNEKEISLNGAAARMVQPGDKVIIASYCICTNEESKLHQPVVLLMNSNNSIKKVINKKNRSV